MCPESSRIHALHDGEVADADIAAVEAHIAQCPDCARERMDLRKLSGRLTEFKPAAPAQMMRRWRSGLRRRQTEELLLVRLSLRVTGIAAALVIAAGIWIWMGASARPAGDTPVAWEQTALLAINDSIEWVNDGDVESNDVELARWIVADLSGVQQ